MPHALVTSRDDRDEDTVHRFDPRFWTVNFPRPAMASVTTTAPDALRVDLAWQGADALVGLIWESADRLSPPLIAYEDRRDYAHTRRSFRWRSAGCRALNVLNGPVLTVEGLDAAGERRAWYVRLWNHAVGHPTDALVTLDFDALDAGYLLPAEADRVWPHAIERMFISLTPDGQSETGWAEMSGIRCEGSGAVLGIGDALVPPHSLRLATAYDDSFNQTPERLLRAALHLGYRRELLHYVGMSHFMALPVGAGSGLCEPARAWHADYLRRAKALGYDLILSLSFELFDAYCPEAWKQRAPNQALGLGDGERTRFALVKDYGDGATRRITRPVAGTIAVALDGAIVAGWSLEEGGEVLFAVAPALGVPVTAGFEFDVPVRFASDRLEITRATALAGEIASVPLVEVRE